MDNKSAFREEVRYVETLLLTLVFLSIVVLLFTALFKTGLALAIASLSAFFYFASIDSWTPILLLVVGLLLIILEIFVPDFGILGVLGFGSIVLGLYYTTGDFGKTMTDLVISLTVSSIFVIFLFKKGYSFTNWDRFVLDAQIKTEENVERIEEDRILTAGMIGKAVTALRPSGKAMFEDMQISFDVLSDDGHISQGTEIIIQEIIGNKIIVRKI